jgi:hypothetical protein
VALQGYRVVHDSRAIAYDKLPDRPADEFRRKLRTLTGNYQLMARLPQALVPWRNPIWPQLVSHKLLRLVVPWALIGVWACSVLLDAPIYRAAVLAQGFVCALALLGMLTNRGGRLASAAASFVMLNTAAWVAFWVWITGRGGLAWQKVDYTVDSPLGPVLPAPVVTEDSSLPPAAGPARETVSAVS